MSETKPLHTQNDQIDVTSMSSKGQVVIPQLVRQKLGWGGGQKFVVMIQNGGVFLKKIEKPAFEEFEELLRKTHDFARIHNIKPKDLADAIKKARQNAGRTRH